MGKSKQGKLNKPNPVSLEIPKKVANKQLIMAPYMPLPVFKSGCSSC